MKAARSVESFSKVALKLTSARKRASSGKKLWRFFQEPAPQAQRFQQSDY
jgi:hypothetical protein